MKGFLPLLIFFLLSDFQVSAQVTDSIHLFSYSPFSGYSPTGDSSLVNFRTDQFDVTRAPLGTKGMPQLQLFYKGYSFHQLDASFFDTTGSPVFHKSLVPYTSVKYFLSSLKSQGLNVDHVQPLSSKIFAGVSYKNLRSEGEFQNQQLKSDWLNLHFNWSAGNYQSALYGVFYQLSRQESGGITDDSIFLERTFRSELFPVALSPGAKTYKRNWLAGLHQELRSRDSTFRLKDHFYYSYKVFEYNDTTAGYYPSYYLDPYSTNEKSEGVLYGNEIGFSIGRNQWEAEFYYKTDLIFYYSDFADINTINHSFMFRGYSHRKKNTFSMKSMYIISGFNKEDYLINFNYKYSLNNNFYTGLNFNALSNKPFMNYFRYYSNNFQWNNELVNVRQVKAEVFAEMKKQQLKGELSLLQVVNPVVIDSSLNLVQDKGNGIIYQFMILKNFKLTRILNWSNQVYLQKITGTDFIRSPEIIAKSSLFISGRAWTATYNLGADSWYFSSWRAHQWIPALNEFALQNSATFGNFAVIDVFLEARIKTVSFYITGSNLTDGYTGVNTFVSEGYPFPGRSVRFGVKWDFKN